jgi:antitoxin component YwqK of YwqJK toxin-antitoxin module
MKKILLFLSILFIVFGCNNYEIKKDYYSNGNLKSVGEFKDGMLDGTLKVFYENGDLKRVVTFREGKKFGPAIDYYKERVIKRRMKYRNDTLDGKVEVFYNSGKLSKSFTYDGGLINGELIEYDTIGNLYSITTYEDGLIVNFKVFHPNGNLFLTEERIDDKRHGQYTVYFEDGTTIDENGIYSKGNRDGWFVRYFPNGVVKDSVLFSNGDWQKAHHYDSLGNYKISKKRK